MYSAPKPEWYSNSGEGAAIAEIGRWGFRRCHRGIPLGEDSSGNHHEELLDPNIELCTGLDMRQPESIHNLPYFVFADPPLHEEGCKRVSEIGREERQIGGGRWGRTREDQGNYEPLDRGRAGNRRRREFGDSTPAESVSFEVT